MRQHGTDTHTFVSWLAGTAAVSSSSGGAAGGAGAGAGAGAASAVLPPSALTVSSSAPLGLVAQGGDAGMAMAS